MVPPGGFDDLTIAVVAFPGAEELDLFGPYEIFWWQAVFQHRPPNHDVTEDEYEETFLPHDGPVPNVFTVGASSTEPLKMSSGSKITPQYSFADAPKVNVIVVPGGHGALKIAERRRDGTMEYILRVANDPANKYIVTVCTGAFLAGAAGLLDGKHCQVNHTLYGMFEKQVSKAKLVKNRMLSFVQDGKLITGNAPASGIPTALRLVADYYGSGYVSNLRNLLAYCVEPVIGAVVENGEIRHVTV
jgi:putative intracellular protease/amidase